MSDDKEISVAEHPAGIHIPFRDPKAQIRLIKFDTEQNSDNISVALETCDVGSAPPYNAISYVWGEPSVRHAITVNNIRLPIRKNCFHALRQARLHYPGDYVWIDAICINQLDVEEKSAQVLLMGAIYAKASLVLACIGPQADFITTAHELYGLAIFQDTGKYDEPWEGDTKVDISTSTNKWYPRGLAHSDVFFPRDDKDRKLIIRLRCEWNELAERQYFRRAWVVQELSGGRHRTMILCGKDIIDWARVMTLGNRLYRITVNPLTQVQVERFDNQPHWLNELVYHNDRYLERYLDMMRFLDCQDVRDRIFSVVSLVDWGAIQILPDYNMSVYRLASELMWRVDFDIDYVADLVAVLDLCHQDTQILEQLRNEGLAYCPGLSVPDTNETWSASVNGAHLLIQESAGRFQILSQLQPKHAAADGCDEWPLEDYDELVTSNIGVQLYIGETLVGLSTGDLREGDILIFGNGFELIVRARSDESTFSVVGGACMSWEFRQWIDAIRDSEVCECWPLGYSDHVLVQVQIELEASRRQVLADRVAREAVGTDICDIRSYLERHAIGTHLAGSKIRDTTAANWPEHLVIGPLEPLCSAHRSSELHRINRNAVWYITLSGSSGIIYGRTAQAATTLH